MRTRSALLILFSLISQVGFSANLCSSLFPAEKTLSEQIDEQDAALSKIAIQHLYEAAIRFVQTKITVSSIRSTEALKTQNKLRLIHFLNSGKHNEAIDIYRSVFDGVELSFARIKQDLATLEKLENSDNNSNLEIRKINLRLQVYQRRFAKHYGEYLEVRSYLEKVSTDGTQSPIFKQAAANTLKYLSVHKFSEVHEDYAALKIPEARPTLTEIKALFRSKALYTRIKLWNDFKGEIISVMKYIISAEIIVGTVDSIFNKFPPETALKLKRFTGLMQSAKLRFRYLNLILDIETLPQDTNLRLEELRRKNSSTPNDELMMTYVRTVDFSDSWNEMKARAKERSLEENNLVYKSFYDRMLAAEAKGLVLSDISLFERGSNVDNILVIIQTGLLLKIAGPTTFSTMHDFFNFAAKALALQ